MVAGSQSHRAPGGIGNARRSIERSVISLTPLLKLQRSGTSLAPARLHPPCLPANSTSMVTPHQPATSLGLLSPTTRAKTNPPKFCRSSHSLTLSEFRRRQVLPTARKPPTRCPTTRYPASHATHLPSTAAAFSAGYTTFGTSPPAFAPIPSPPAFTPVPCMLWHPRPRPPGSSVSSALRPRPTAPHSRHR